MVMLTYLVQGIITLALLVLAVVVLLFDLYFLAEVVRWFRSSRWRQWRRTPPPPWREEARNLWSMLRSAWRSTRALLRM